MERAKQLILLLPEFDLLDENSWPSMEQTLAEALAEARREEREQAAHVILDWIAKQRKTGADKWHRYDFSHFEALAAAIINLP
jgi:hypothetical protein